MSDKLLALALHLLNLLQFGRTWLSQLLHARFAQLLLASG